MPIFKCGKCNNLDNTVFGDYWECGEDKANAKCYRCLKGKWHNRFPEEKFNSFWHKISQSNRIKYRWYCWRIIKWHVVVKTGHVKYWLRKLKQ